MDPLWWSGDRQIIFFVGVLLIVVVTYWAFKLIVLRSSITSNAKYWLERSSKSGDLTYVAFGDSSAQSIGASKPDKGYVGLIAEKYSIATGKSVKVINLSKSGAKVSDVLETQLSAYRKLGIDKPDLVTLEIGANDLKDYDEARFTKEFKKIVVQLPFGTFVSDVPDYGKPENRRYAKVSRIMQNEINLRTDLHFVPLGLRTSKEQKFFGTYSYDFYHPNDKGYEIWSAAYWQEIESVHRWNC